MKIGKINARQLQKLIHMGKFDKVDNMIDKVQKVNQVNCKLHWIPKS